MFLFAVEFDFSGSYLAIAGADVRYGYHAPVDLVDTKFQLSLVSQQTLSGVMTREVDVLVVVILDFGAYKISVPSIIVI